MVWHFTTCRLQERAFTKPRSWYWKLAKIDSKQTTFWRMWKDLDFFWSPHNLKSPTWVVLVATPLWRSVKMTFTLPKCGLGSHSGLPKTQNSIAGVKTPRLELFFISLKRSWNVDVKNGLTWVWRTLEWVNILSLFLV